MIEVTPMAPAHPPNTEYLIEQVKMSLNLLWQYDASAVFQVISILKNALHSTGAEMEWPPV